MMIDNFLQWNWSKMWEKYKCNQLSCLDWISWNSNLPIILIKREICLCLSFCLLKTVQKGLPHFKGEGGGSAGENGLGRRMGSRQKRTSRIRILKKGVNLGLPVFEEKNVGRRKTF